MTHYDIFNGDADGICALLQLRLQHPLQSQCITGIKRDIALCQRVDVKKDDCLTVLDISFDKNREAINKALHQGAHIFYCDHHYTGELPQHTHLTTHINTNPNVCTSLLINTYLKNAFTHWAIVGAFGDNLTDSAHALAKQSTLKQSQLNYLEKLGIYINYNAYGGSLDDLHIHPKLLYQQLLLYPDPLVLKKHTNGIFDHLETSYHDDMRKIDQAHCIYEHPQAAVFHLPNAAWARRVSGTMGNQLANRHPKRAHAIVTEQASGDYLVSVRAPLINRQGADTLCRQFPTGGGRAAAAGINQLPSEQLNNFVEQFSQHYL